jgi:hypothetical protein
MNPSDTAMDTAAIRAFLKLRNAVAVHFSTVMTRHQDLLFPDDLKQAMALSGLTLSFSTIQPGDTHRLGGKGGAEGSVGMRVDLGPNTVVESVAPDDSGSIWDPATATSGSLGHLPTPETCAESMDRRTESNEWLIKNYIPRASLFCRQFSCESDSRSMMLITSMRLRFLWKRLSPPSLINAYSGRAGPVLLNMTATQRGGNRSASTRYSLIEPASFPGCGRRYPHGSPSSAFPICRLPWRRI